jgi:hypothetical protein
MQGDSVCSKESLRAVATVAEDREPPMRELDSNLVMPPCLKVNLNEADAIGITQSIIA